MRPHGQNDSHAKLESWVARAEALCAGESAAAAEISHGYVNLQLGPCGLQLCCTTRSCLRSNAANRQGALAHCHTQTGRYGRLYSRRLDATTLVSSSLSSFFDRRWPLLLCLSTNYNQVLEVRVT
jgi:hypothetical protein